MTIWPNTPLGEILELAYGKSLSLRTRRKGSIPVYGSNGVTGWHDEALVADPTLVVGRKGSAGAVHRTTGPSFPIDTTFYVKLRDPDLLCLDYLFFALRAINLPRLAISTGVPGLNREDAYRELIPVPPLDEQRRIVDLLNRAEGIRRLAEEAQAKARDLIPALFVDMFGDPATNPKGWQKGTFGELLRVKSGTFLPADQMDRTGVVNVYGGNGITGQHSVAMFDEPKVVIGRVGAHCGNVHITTPKSWVTDNALYVAETRAEFSSIFLVAALRQAKLNRLASQSGQPLISAGRLKNVPLLVPPLTLQNDFASRVDEIQGARRLAERAEIAADALSHSLMAQVFRPNAVGETKPAKVKVEELV